MKINKIILWLILFCVGFSGCKTPSHEQDVRIRVTRQPMTSDFEHEFLAAAMRFPYAFGVKVLWSNRGNFLCTHGHTDLLVLWDTKNWKGKEYPLDYTILDLTWSPNDRYLAILSGHPKRGLYILDAENGFQEVTHFEYSQDITSLAWINENEIIITTDQDNLILIQDIKKENPEKFPADSDYRNVFYAVGFNYIFVSNGSTIFTLDLKSFERIHQFPCKISQHFNVPVRRPILGCECDSNKSLCFVDIQTGKVIKKKEFPVTTMRSAKWTNDGHYFAYLSNNGFVLIDYLNNHVVWRPTFESFPLSMSWSPDGKYIATGHGYGEIRIWDIEKIIQVSGE